ncbi:MAG: ROK family protein [Clostridia bacterium]
MFFIGVDIGGMSIKAGIVDDGGKIVAKKSIITIPTKASVLIVGDIAKLILDILAENNMAVCDIQGIGLGFPGSIFDECGIVRYCCNINLINVPVVEMLQNLTSIKNIKISNDANCAALGETKFGAGKGAKNSVMVTLGTGVGTGIIVDGKMLTGNCSAGAEGGHMQINFGKAQCGCGKHGHFEAYASATALIAQTKEAAEKHPESALTEIIKSDGLDGRTLFTAMKRGDKVAISTFKRYIKFVGVGLVNFANIFFPEVFIIGGGISNEGDTLIKPLQSYVSKNVYGAKYNPHISVVAATLKNDAGIIGAATLTMNE